MPIKFSIIETRELTEQCNSNSKYTVYVISLVKVGTLDRDGIIIERRYRQFHTLNDELNNDYPLAMKDIDFPKKTYLSSSLNNVIVQERLRLLENYLSQILEKIPDVRSSKPFQQFFQLHHMKEAVEHLTCNRYSESYQEYTMALRLAKKLDGSKNQMIWMLCGMVECNRCLDKLNDAEKDGTECLDIMNYDINHSALFPLMKVMIDIRKALCINTERLRNMYSQLQTLSYVDVDSMRMLRELCVVPVDRVFSKSYSK